MLFTASAVGSQTTLARIIRMVRRAQSSKPEIGQLADKISAVFVPAVVVIALISAAIWYFFGPAPQIVYTGHCHHGTDYRLSVRLRRRRRCRLSPALAGRRSMACWSAMPMRCSAPVNSTPVFDKTGTLTEGKPQVVAVKTFAGVDEHTALRLAAALEQGSSHPLARAILIKLPTAHCRKSAASAPYAALASAARRKVIVCCSVTGRYSTSSISIPLRWKAR